MLGQMNLILVKVADFRRTERTNFLDRNIVPAATRKAMEPGDVVCLHSSSGNQVVFVFAPASAARADGARIEVTASTRLRLEHHRRWDPLMIADYAAEAGIRIKHLDLLKDRLKPFGRQESDV